jgi:hypothetical protein
MLVSALYLRQPFTLLASAFSIRVQVRFDVRGSMFAVRGSRFDVRGSRLRFAVRVAIGNTEPEHEHEPRSENLEV